MIVGIPPTPATPGVDPKDQTGIIPGWPLIKVMAGGQTGVDQGAWRAAEALGYDTGGYMPADAKTESGKRPDLAVRYHAMIIEDGSYETRTRLNVKHSDATLWLGDPASAGGVVTLRAIRQYRKPKLIITAYELDTAADAVPTIIRMWILARQIRTLHVAGNRESKHLGIGALAESVLVEAWRR